jgi:hypothetical protein
MGCSGNAPTGEQPPPVSIDAARLDGQWVGRSTKLIQDGSGSTSLALQFTVTNGEIVALSAMVDVPLPAGLTNRGYTFCTFDVAFVGSAPIVDGGFSVDAASVDSTFPFTAPVAGTFTSETEAAGEVGRFTMDGLSCGSHLAVYSEPRMVGGTEGYHDEWTARRQ